MKNFQEVTFHIMQQKKIHYDCSKLWDFSRPEMAENAQTDETDSQH